MSIRKRMADKHLYTHIFYINQALNFKYDFKWDRSNPPQPPYPTSHKPNVPVNTINKLYPEFKGKTVVVVGSGPSLNKNVAQLKELEDNPDVILLSCDGSIWDLAHHNIKPDYVISTEADGQHNRPQIPTTDLLLDGGDISIYKDVPLIADTWLNNEFHRRWPCPDRYWFVNYDIRPTYRSFWDLHQDIFPDIEEGWPLIEPRASIVGFFGVEVAKHLGAKEVVLVGCDMAAKKDKHHSDLFNIKWEDSNINLQQCYADHFEWFLNYYEGRFDFPVVNCTEGGVLTEGCTDAKWMTLQDKIKELKGALNGAK